MAQSVLRIATRSSVNVALDIQDSSVAQVPQTADVVCCVDVFILDWIAYGCLFSLP